MVYRTVPVCCAGYSGDGQTCTRKYTTFEVNNLSRQGMFSYMQFQLCKWKMH